VSTSPFDAWITNDDEVAFRCLSQEWNRQTSTLQLIASENFASPSVFSATGSVLTNKYAEGYPGRRYYGGNQIIDEVEDLARRRLTAPSAPTTPMSNLTSGANANVAVYQALLDAGDTILAMRLDQGGHLTHGSPVSVTSKYWHFVSLWCDAAIGRSRCAREHIDFDNVRDLAIQHRPKLIVAGATAYARIIDPAPFREIAGRGWRVADVRLGNVAGLIAGGSHPNPVPTPTS